MQTAQTLRVFVCLVFVFLPGPLLLKELHKTSSNLALWKQDDKTGQKNAYRDSKTCRIEILCEL